jgi:16S rRNA (guanine527-N7)-methyltransferase
LDLIRKYFPWLSEQQLSQLAALETLYADWNSKINVISRKDMEQFYVHHVLHSLSIANVIRFQPGTKIMDVGTGGGFPGIPLAIVFPDSRFHLVDSIGKKIKVVEAVAESIGLKNVNASHARAESVNEKFDFIVSRAVATFAEFIPWVKKSIRKESINGIPNGILYLKGGDLTEEMQAVKNYYEIFELKEFFEEEYFETKKVVYVQM